MFSSSKGDEVAFSKYRGGPLGLGDPNDRSLRKVEKEVMIPKKMRDVARTEKCIPEVELFNECCKKNGILSVWSCQTENKSMRACLTKWYRDEGFINRCTEEYLAERSEYRQTGINKNKKSVRVGNSPSPSAPTSAL